MLSVPFLIQYLFDRGDLEHDSSDRFSIFFFFSTVCHMNNLFTIISAENTLQGYPSRYTLVLADRTGPAEFKEKGGPFMSDGGSRLREQQIDPESAKPPSLTSSSL